jgi:hypothetical protein
MTWHKDSSANEERALNARRGTDKMMNGYSTALPVSWLDPSSPAPFASPWLLRSDPQYRSYPNGKEKEVQNADNQ